MKVGILGGTFNPIHMGHLIIAEEARVRLELAEVLFIPAGKPWLKENSDILPAYHRLEMVRLAVAGNPFFRLSTAEIDRSGPSYAVDTITIIKQQYVPETGLYFILGWDSLAELSAWKDPLRLVRMCHLVTIPRPGTLLPDLDSLETAIPGARQSIIMLDMNPIGISSTDIRHRLGQGLSIHYLVSEAVEQYIQEHRLYR